MTTPPLPLWQTFHASADFSDPGDCEQNVTQFEKQIERRNRLEYAAAFTVIGFFGVGSIIALALGEFAIGLALVMVAAGSLVTVWNLKRRGTNIERRPEDPCRVHLRRQYQRQYDALRSVPTWYVGPIMPGLLLFYALVTARTAGAIGWERALDGALVPGAITIGIVVAVLIANRLAARSLRREIEALDALA